jgi:hypothetical protein
MIRTTENTMRGKIASLLGAGLLGIFGFAWGSTAASQLKPEAIESFEHYVQSKESRMDETIASENTFLWIDGLAQPTRVQAETKLKEGRVVVDRSETGESADGIHIRGGLIHDWIGIIFIPNVSLTQTLALAQDYDHATQNYSPEVERSRLLSRSGDNFRVFLRLKRTDVLTTVFDTEYDISYVMVGAKRAYSRSHSTRIAEVADPDTPHEHEKPIGKDNGFLWRLYSYWRFEQVDGGVYIQCEAISLTRDIPSGFAWLVRPFIRNIPDQSLTSALEESRKALVPEVRGASAFDKPREPKGPLR